VNGLRATGNTLFLVAKSFFYLFTRAFYDLSIFKSVAGPIGIADIAVDVGSWGLVYLLQFIALISLNLAVLNLIPVPALDGGRFLFLLIEKIKGNPISRKFQIAVNGIGFALLLALMVVVTIQDIGKL
ncbi:MAG: site-2 protease family protein, partial [Patescibacteria group bacterium]